LESLPHEYDGHRTRAAGPPVGDGQVDRYRVAAAPDRVIDAIARSLVAGSMFGYSFSDSSSAVFVGKVMRDGSFDLRRPRGVTTAPRVAVLRGKVEPADGVAVVAVRYGLHPVVVIARGAWLLFLGLTAVVIGPASLGGAPELLWVLAVFAFIIGLMFVPSELLARADRAKLRSDLETILPAVGSTALERDA